MSFLYPDFLWALSLLSIPVIIHLFNFRRYKTVYFPSIKFLREVKEKTTSASTLKHLLVLLSRLLAVAFLVFAFAQPYIKEKNTKVLSGSKAVSVYIDNSFSMNAISSDLSLLETAKHKAKEIALAFSADDKFQLLTNDFEGRHQRLVNRDQFLNMVDEVKQSPDVKNISQIIERQKSALTPSNSSNKLLYLISDFQKTTADLQTIKPDSSFTITFIPLKASVERNVYIDSCWTESPVQMLNQPVKLFVKLKNNSDEDLQNSRLTLTINEQAKSISNFSVPANGSAVDTISFNTSSEGWNKCELSITDYPVTFDDNYYFTFYVAVQIPVMVINEKQENSFLKALFSNPSVFSYKPATVTQINYAEIKQQQFIILTDVQDISSGLSEALRNFITEGGSLLLFPEDKANLSSLNSFLTSIGAANLSSWNSAPRQVTYINTQEKIFHDVFENKNEENIALPKTKGNFILTSGTQTVAEPLMKLNDGSAFITKYSFGKGLFYLCVSPLDKTFSDLPVSPLFAPMLFKMAVTRSTSPMLAYFIGSNSSVELNNSGVTGEAIFRLKGPKSEMIPAQRNIGNTTIVSFHNLATEAGFYQIYLPNTDHQAWYGLNYNRKESDLSCWSDTDLKSFAQTSDIRLISDSKANLTAAIGERNLGVTLWKLCLAFTLLFIATEILLLRFWK